MFLFDTGADNSVATAKLRILTIRNRPVKIRPAYGNIIRTQKRTIEYKLTLQNESLKFHLYIIDSDLDHVIIVTNGIQRCPHLINNKLEELAFKILHSGDL